MVILLKDSYFYRVETILALMNVLAYVNCFTDHKLERLIIFCNDYTFIISTDILTLMKIYFLVMKGKRCNGEISSFSDFRGSRAILTDQRLYFK